MTQLVLFTRVWLWQRPLGSILSAGAATVAERSGEFWTAVPRFLGSFSWEGFIFKPMAELGVPSRKGNGAGVVWECPDIVGAP